MDWNQSYPKGHPPTPDQIDEFICNPLWTNFNEKIYEIFKTEPRMEYSCCSMQPGWNIKYKKNGKSLCTLYPMKGYFIALVVIGPREMNDAEWMMPSCPESIQKVFRETQAGQGQKWLMLEVQDSEISDCILNLIALRAKSSKQK